MYFGVAHFIEPDEPTESRVFAYDGAALKVYDNWSELPDTKTWLSNVNRATLSSAKLANLMHIKSAQFLTVPQDSLVKELLLPVSDEPSLRSFKRLYEVYAFVFLRLADSFGRVDIRHESRLTAEIAKKITLNESDRFLSPGFLGIVNDCYSLSITVPGRRLKPTNKIVNLSYPRAPYAYHLLSQRVPQGEWQKISRTNKRYGYLYECKGDSLIDGFNQLAEERAAFVKIALVNRKSNEDLTVIRLGNPGGEWLTVIEAIELSEYVEIKMLDMLVSESTIELSELLEQWGLEKPEKSELFSVSYGYFLTEIWRTLTSEQVMAADNSAYYTPSATYIKAYDRIACMYAAESVLGRGFDVNAYGNNMISTSVPEEYISALLELGYEKGLIAQTDDGEEIVAEHSMSVSEAQKDEQQDKHVKPYSPPRQ